MKNIRAVPTFLMNGFDKKNLHLVNKGEQDVELTMEIDFEGNDTWHSGSGLK